MEWNVRYSACPGRLMIFRRLVLGVTLLGSAVWADKISIVGGSPDPVRPTATSTSTDTIIISLPAPPPSVAKEAPAPAVPQPAPPPLPKMALPADFQQESALFLQKLIGTWTLTQARALLGEARGQRPSFDDDKSPVGRIYAFSDPSGRYKELELDFDLDSGRLHGVFAYPAQMTWQDCRRLWGASVTSTDVPNGRTFYSYTNRHLDVLVDHEGKVVSIGLY